MIELNEASSLTGRGFDNPDVIRVLGSLHAAEFLPFRLQGHNRR